MMMLGRLGSLLRCCSGLSRIGGSSPSLESRLRTRLALLILFFIILNSSPTSPFDFPSLSSQMPRETAGFQYHATVSLKLIQVIVTDSRGTPITDLEKGDFAITDNGDDKVITEFERHSFTLPAPVWPGALETSKATASAEPQRGLLPRKFYVLFDTVFADVNGFRKSRDAILRFIEKDLRPQDEMGVMAFTGGRSLSVRSPLGNDHEAALAAVRSLAPGDLMRQIAPPDGGDDDDYGRVVTSSSDAKGNSFAIGSSPIAADARLVAGNFIWSLRGLAQALRYEPGLKYLIFCSNGIRGKNIGRGEYSFGRNADLNRDYEDMCRELSAANVAVYPISTADTTIGFHEIDKTDWKESRTGVPFLRELASHTGGLFLGAARNAPELMNRVQTLTGTYYVIGYPISETWDGKYHAVRVRVRRPSVVVQAQPGYFNPKPFAHYSELEREIDLIDLALAENPLSQEPLRFAMMVWPDACAPPDNLHLLAEVLFSGLGGVAGQRVEFVSLIFDSMDRIVDLSRAEIRMAADGHETAPVFLYAKLEAPPGRYRCRMVLRNLESGRAAVAGSDLFLPVHEPGSILIFPPLFAVATEVGTTYLGAARKDAQGKPISAEALAAEAFLFNPGRFSLWPKGPVRSHSALYAVLPAALEASDVTKLRLTAILADESAGTELSVPLSVIAEKGRRGGRVFFIRLDIPDLEWGAYILTFVLEDGTNGRSARLPKVISIE